jgi:HSP20 family molecular chaperone IbpA
MKEDPQDVFGQMDAIFAQMVAEMTRGMVSGMPPYAIGYRILIRDNGAMPDGAPFESVIKPRDQQGPAPEVHRIGHEVKVVAELPGAVKESIRLNVQGSILTIEADGRDRHYQTVAELPPVDADSMQTSFKNGVLEVTFKARHDVGAERPGRS